MFFDEREFSVFDNNFIASFDIIHSQPSDKVKRVTKIRIIKHFLKNDVCYFSRDKDILKSVMSNKNLLIYDVAGAVEYPIGECVWNGLGYDVFLGKKLHFTMEAAPKSKIIRVIFRECRHDKNIYCNKWPFIIKRSKKGESDKLIMLESDRHNNNVLLCKGLSQDEYEVSFGSPWNGFSAFAVCAFVLLQ